MIGIDIKAQRRSYAASDSISSAGAVFNARAENWGHGVPCLSAWTWLVTTVAARLPFGPAHARRLVRIGADPRLLEFRERMPSDIETLNTLTQLPDAKFDALVKQGVIRPELPRHAAVAWVRANRDTAQGLAVRSPDQSEDQFKALMKAWEAAWPVVRQRFLHRIDNQLEPQ